MRRALNSLYFFSSSSFTTSSFSFLPFLLRLPSSGSSASSAPHELPLGTPLPQPPTTIAPAMDLESGEPFPLPLPQTTIAPTDLESGEPSPLPQPPTTMAPTDLESGEPSPLPQPQTTIAPMADIAADAKLVQTVALAMAALSLVLFFNAPAADALRPELVVAYAAYLAFVCLAFFSSLCLSMHAVVCSSGDPSVAALHKWALVVVITFVLCAFVLLLTLVLPGTVPLHYVLAFLVLGVLGALASRTFFHVAGKIAHTD